MKNRLPPTFAKSFGNGRKTRDVTPPGAPSLPLDATPTTANHWLCRVADSAGQRPVAALAIAFGAGLIIGKLVKR